MSSPRIVVIGKNSTVWRRLRDRLRKGAHDVVALGHSEIDRASFDPDDCLWIFSYAREPEKNRQMLAALAGKVVGRSVYLSTATANVASVTRCYGYPTAKADAERAAVDLLGATIVRVGIVYEDPRELPAGINAATSLDEIAAAMMQSGAGVSLPHDLFTMIERSFGSAFERSLYRLYGGLMALTGAFPCSLRPFDILLRAAGIRWYGYLYLSNKLWLRHRLRAAKI